MWGPASTTSHAVGQTDAAIDSTRWEATAKGLSGAWGQAGVTTGSGVEGEGGEAMIIPPVAAGRRQQDGAGWWHVGGE
ncbi:hypothetical protein [Halohasta litorea]|uniref:hypothetical protein n=1 Tax=Halohasta litorea TaxID=869891 RepID=UPI002112764D|nr:hypothetical protein [Halohasta litorea]